MVIYKENSFALYEANKLVYFLHKKKQIVYTHTATCKKINKASQLEFLHFLLFVYEYSAYGINYFFAPNTKQNFIDQSLAKP